MKHVLAISILFVSLSAFGQEDSLYRLSLSVGGGWGFRVSHITVPNTQLEISTSSPAGSVRMMWEPDHMLSVGFESGFVPITQVSSKGPIKPDEEDGNANLSAIPILAVFSMDKYGVDLSAGVGMYSLVVSGKSNKGSIKNSAIELGYMFSAAYTYKFSERFGIGLNIKYYAFTDREIAMLVPQLGLRWNLMVY